MGLENVSDFISLHMESHVDKLFRSIPNKRYTTKEFKEIVEEYEMEDIFNSYTRYLEDNSIQYKNIYDDEMAVLSCNFYTNCMNRFNGEREEY